MKWSKKISIVIPTYNDSELLRNTIICILKSTMPREDYEVLICDDGSEVDNLKLIREFESLCDIKFFYQRDSGFRAGQARNMGINNSKGEIILFLDTGVLLDKNTLTEVYKDISKNHHSVIGYMYGFSNDTDDADLIKKLIDINDIDNSIVKLRDNNI